jgi:hypothetical protein
MRDHSSREDDPGLSNYIIPSKRLLFTSVAAKNVDVSERSGEDASQGVVLKDFLETIRESLGISPEDTPRWTDRGTRWSFVSSSSIKTEVAFHRL